MPGAQCFWDQLGYAAIFPDEIMARNAGLWIAKLRQGSRARAHASVMENERIHRFPAPVAMIGRGREITDEGTIPVQ